MIFELALSIALFSFAFHGEKIKKEERALGVALFSSWLATYIISVAVLSMGNRTLALKDKKSCCTPSPSKRRKIRRLQLWAALMADTPMINIALAITYYTETLRFCK